jgi:photosystem II stability/assembly factor-like uncharacterized protein
MCITRLTSYFPKYTNYRVHLKSQKMKKLFVFIPAIILVSFLLNSFVLKEKEGRKITTQEAKSSTGAVLDDKFYTDPFAKVSFYNVNRNKLKPVNHVLRSTDGGQTWQSISKGLPQTDQPVNLFTGESDLYLHLKNTMYRSKSDLTTPFWEKVNVPDLQSSSSRPSTSVAFNGSGVMAFNYDGHIYQALTAAKNWLPLYPNFKKTSLRTVFETSGGAVFLGYDHGLYRSTDKGKTWKQVQKGLILNVVESEGVLLALGGKGIMRSADNGEHWQWVISEGGVGIAVERINGGFAAISYNTKTKSRRIRISLDGGKAWQTIDHGLPPSSLISSIKQTGRYLVCGHPDGIFRSSDMGKSWTKVYPGVEERSFKITVSGNVLYAVEANAGC